MPTKPLRRSSPFFPRGGLRFLGLNKWGKMIKELLPNHKATPRVWEYPRGAEMFFGAIQYENLSPHGQCSASLDARRSLEHQEPAITGDLRNGRECHPSAKLCQKKGCFSVPLRW